MIYEGNNFNDHAIDAMDALFKFAEAMNHGVTMHDLMDVMKKAIDGGHDNLAICLMMAVVAVEKISPCPPLIEKLLHKMLPRTTTKPV